MQLWSWKEEENVGAPGSPARSGIWTGGTEVAAFNPAWFCLVWAAFSAEVLCSVPRVADGMGGVRGVHLVLERLSNHAVYSDCPEP